MLAEVVSLQLADANLFYFQKLENGLWQLLQGNLIKVSGQPTLWETHSWTYCEKHKVLLVVLPNTVIDPGAVVVHFPYAAFTNTVKEPASLA